MLRRFLPKEQITSEVLVCTDNNIINVEEFLSHHRTHKLFAAEDENHFLVIEMPTLGMFNLYSDRLDRLLSLNK